MATRCGGKHLHLALIGSSRLMYNPADSHLPEATALWFLIVRNVSPLIREAFLYLKIKTTGNRIWLVGLSFMDKAFFQWPPIFLWRTSPEEVWRVCMPRWINKIALSDLSSVSAHGPEGDFSRGGCMWRRCGGFFHWKDQRGKKCRLSESKRNIIQKKAMR